MPIMSSDSGGAGVTESPEVEALHSFLRYNDSTDMVESIKPLRTTLHSLYFGDIHSMGSINSNVIWTNEVDKTSYIATGTALGPHNQGVSGQWVDNRPSSRFYFAYGAEDLGGMGDGVITYPYNSGVISYPGNTSEWGHEYAAGEAYTGTVHYKVWLSANAREYLIVDRQYEVDLALGDVHQQLFDAPIDIINGQQVRFELLKDDAQTPLQVYGRADVVDDYWVKIYVRSFDHRTLPFQQDLVNLEFAMAQDEDNFPARTLMYPNDGFIFMDNNGTPDTIIWPLGVI